MEKKKVLICGATGFIGRNLAEFLAKRDDLDIVCVHHSRSPFEFRGVSWLQADLTNTEDVTRALESVDIVIQAAATTSGSKDIISRPYIHITDNAVMNALLLRAAHDQKVKHVIFFSCTIMLQSNDRALSESDFDANEEMHPNYFGAGWTKVYNEKMCEFYSRLGGTRFTVIRHSNIFGPHDKFDLERSHVFGAMTTKVMTATDGTVTILGDGEEARDFLYVADLVDFVERAMDRQLTDFEIFNCGGGAAITVNDIVKKIIKISGRNIEIRHDLSVTGIKTSLFLDCSKAKEKLDWEPRTSIEDGISQTISWWRDTIGEA